MAENATDHQVKRELKTRHLSMIALGGSIGTGLFVASGSAISTAGPGGGYSRTSRWAHGLFLNDKFGRNGNKHANFRIVCCLFDQVC